MPSTLIAAFDDSPEQQLLDISFLTGRSYRYFAVPASTVEQMRSSFSRGAFFNRHIRGHFVHQERPALPGSLHKAPVRSR